MKREPRRQIPFDVHDYLRPLYRRRWLAGTVFSIPLVIALIHAFTATPVYRATARLLVEPQDPTVVTFQEVIRERGQFGISAQTTQRDMLRSRSLARMAIERLGLLDHPEFGGQADQGARFNLLRWLNPIAGARRGLSWLRSKIFPSAPPPEDVEDAESRAESRAISSLLSKLQIVGAERNSRIVTLRFSSFEPQLAATVVNTLAQLHVERDMEFRYTSSRNAARWLEERMAEQREALEASEWLLQSYREQHGAAAIEDRQTIIVRDLENLNTAATEATMARLASEARYLDLQAAGGDADAQGRFPDILRNEVVQQQKLTLASLRREKARLTEELGPRHPEMINIESSIRDAENRLRNEILAVVDSLRIEFQVASSREQQLLAELDRRTLKALALDRTGIEYGVMRREAESARQLYEALLLRAAETGVTAELETSNIRLLDEAETPIRPARPNRRLIVLMGLLGGGLLAVGLVFVLEHVDDALTTPDEIKTHLDAPYLGLVPYAKVKAASRVRKVLDDESPEPLLLDKGVPASFGRGHPVRAYQPDLFVGGRGRPARTRNEHRARRGQELHIGESRDIPGPVGAAHAPRGCRSPAPPAACVVWRGPRTRPVEPARNGSGGGRRRPGDLDSGTLAGPGRKDTAQSDRSRRFPAVCPVCGLVPRPVRLDRLRHDAGPSGGGCAGGRQGRGARCCSSSPPERRRAGPRPMRSRSSTRRERAFSAPYSTRRRWNATPTTTRGTTAANTAATTAGSRRRSQTQRRVSLAKGRRQRCAARSRDGRAAIKVLSIRSASRSVANDSQATRRALSAIRSRRARSSLSVTIASASAAGRCGSTVIPQSWSARTRRIQPRVVWMTGMPAASASNSLFGDTESKTGTGLSTRSIAVAAPSQPASISFGIGGTK